MARLPRYFVEDQARHIIQRDTPSLTHAATRATDRFALRTLT